MQTKKPDELLRERLQKRAENSNKVKPSPSELRSKRMKKKFGVVEVRQMHHDCNSCNIKPQCDKNSPYDCGVQIDIHRCQQCGLLYHHRIAEWKFEYCTPCYISIIKERERENART